jgi:uncharacterized membrane protein (DUF485 family)
VDPVSHDRLEALHTRRWRIALTLTATMVVLYFGFIALIAYDRTLMAKLLTPGLSVGIALGALVIVVSWLLTWWYVHWANTRYDVELRQLQDDAQPKTVAAGDSR